MQSMELKDFLALAHPILAIAIVFPMLGIVLNMAWQTRRRRQQIASGDKSKIPPIVGQEHLKAGRILSGSVVGVTLLGLGYAIFEHILSKDVWSKNSFQVIFIILMFVATIASLVMLYRARPAMWRGIFATLTGIGLVVLGTQDGVFRRTNEWYWSHYYIGITAALLMVFSLAIIEDIYKDKSNRWRTIHVVLNSIAVLLFLGQGMTGTRDLLEIPLSWQKPFIYSCDFANKTCPKP
jgi:drug/metabolite transporter (DMT)-like permease